MNWVSLIISLAALQSVVFGGMVGWARSKYKVEAPATTGNEVFERYFRVHYNTNEQLIIFLPSIWFYGAFISSMWAARLGGTYLVGRVLYAIGYIKAPKQREFGSLLSTIPTLTLLVGAIYGAIRAIVTG